MLEKARFKISDLRLWFKKLKTDEQSKIYKKGNDRVENQ